MIDIDGWVDPQWSFVTGIVSSSAKVTNINIANCVGC
jgi:hypothetical protein